MAYHEGYWLTHEVMKRFWNNYAPDNSTRKDPSVSPLQASIDQLKGTATSTVITEGFDVLRDGSEAYALKLLQAGVPVTAKAYRGMSSYSVTRVFGWHRFSRVFVR